MLNHYRSFQQVVLFGRLGHDAVIRPMKTGGSMLTFSVSTSVSVKDASGSYSQKTTWHECLMFGPRIEKLKELLTKGKTVCLQGSISYRQVELKNGYKGQTASIVVDDVQIGSEPKSQTAASAPSRAPAPARKAAAAPAAAAQAYDEPPFDYPGGEEIPC